MFFYTFINQMFKNIPTLVLFRSASVVCYFVIFLSYSLYPLIFFKQQIYISDSTFSFLCLADYEYNQLFY